MGWARWLDAMGWTLTLIYATLLPQAGPILLGLYTANTPTPHPEAHITRGLNPHPSDTNLFRIRVISGSNVLPTAHTLHTIALVKQTHQEPDWFEALPGRKLHQAACARLDGELPARRGKQTRQLFLVPVFSSFSLFFIFRHVSLTKHHISRFTWLDKNHLLLELLSNTTFF